MNVQIFFIFLLVFCVTMSCSSGDVGIICAQEVSFEKDGAQTTFAITEVGQERRATLELMDTFYLNPNSLSKVFTLTIQEGARALFFDLLINVSDSESCIPLGVYDVNTSSYTEGHLSFTYVDGVILYQNDIGLGAGNLEITECDFENKQISGRFNVHLKRGNSDSIMITNGVFEKVCFTE